MSGKIYEFFGYRVSDKSPVAAEQAASENCPFTGSKCIKSVKMEEGKIVAGACTVVQKTAGSPAVICCPNRLYADEYNLLKEISQIAFGEELLLLPGNTAASHSINNKVSTVAVFGHGWDRELRLPKKDGSGNYFVDWILAKIDKNGSLADFCAVEVQTIDTTGNYHQSRRALIPPQRTESWSNVGLNWENVHKRILPQIIYKSQVLSRESLCQSGLFFVTPSPVLDRIFDRLGGRDNVLGSGRLQASSITFLAYDFDDNHEAEDGRILPLRIVDKHMTLVSEVRDAFNRVPLPEAEVYGNAIRNAIGDFT